MTTDYQRIAHQVTGQVQAIERADASEQRLLALELALSDYQAYLLASQDIATQMHDTQAGSLPAGPELLDIPKCLIRLDAELKAIDQILAAHLSRQDAQDAEIKMRV
jgi:hypothetical protein